MDREATAVFLVERREELRNTEREIMECGVPEHLSGALHRKPRTWLTNWVHRHRMNATAPDLTTTFPRSGRDMLGHYAWLARLADKVRAEHAGTEGEYVAYCGLSTGFLDRVGVTSEDFDRLITRGAGDDDLVKYFDERVSPARRDTANAFVLDEMKEHLDEQDAEEGRA